MARKPSPPEPDEIEPTPPPEPAPQTATPLPEPPPAQTAADEQRQRSDEIARMGVEKWKAEHDERTEEEKAGRQVTGVAPPVPESGSWEGSTRTTPPARAAQNPAASR